MDTKLINNHPYLVGHFLLRSGLAFAFLYPPFAAIGDPIGWAGYLPDFAQRLPVDPIVLLHIFGAVEVVLAVWIISGRALRIPGILMALMLLAIVCFNLNDFATLFRDVSLAFASLALSFMPRPTARQLINDGA